MSAWAIGHDDRDQHNLDDLPEPENIIQPDWLPVQPPPLGPLMPLQQPVTPLPLPPPPPPQPTQSISIDEIFAHFRSVLNLQLIPEDERNTDATAAARREAATTAAAAAAAARLARADFVDFVRPVTPTPEELISLLHRYPEGAASALPPRSTAAATGRARVRQQQRHLTPFDAASPNSSASSNSSEKIYIPVTLRKQG
jgi:hypothetical protein